MQRAGSDGWAVVVEAKLVVPTVRPDTIVRERLVGLLDEALERPLTVACAPAGYGKTTAVATWLATVDDDRAWISLDALDNDPRRLCAHVLAAIDRVLPETVDDAWQALGAGADLLDTVVPLAARAIAAHVERRLVLVLDDYHAVEHPDGHGLVSALVDAVPASVRVVVCSRTASPLRIARRRALGTVAELGVRELAFQRGEAERLLNGSLGLGLAPDAVAAIEARVEGWPAGLALVAAALPARTDRSAYVRGLGEKHPDVTGAAVADYLVEEVLDRAEPRLREFLCRTSILSRLSGPLCAAVLEDRSAHEQLADVRRSNAFVVGLDENGVAWLRYHHLFAELLERELHAASPELVPVLHRRASEWFAANGFVEEAIAHAIAAGDGERAATLLHDTWRTLAAQRRWVTLRRIIAQLPPERGEFATFCEALDTLMSSLEGDDLRLVAQRLDALERRRSAPGVAQIVDVMRIFPFHGDVGRAARYGWAAWERYKDSPLRFSVAAQLGLVLWFAGEGARAREVIEPLLGGIDLPPSRTWAFGTLAFVAADDGDLELAERHARAAVDVAESHGGRGALESHFAYTALGEALRLRGALEEAGEHHEQALRLTGKHAGSLYRAFSLTFAAQMHLSCGDRTRARAAADAARAIVDAYPDIGVLADRLARVEQGTRRRTDRDLPGTEPTAAERRVLALLATDLTLEQIAAQLYLSIHTVSTHRRRLYRRLGATSREDVVAIARRRGLL